MAAVWLAERFGVARRPEGASWAQMLGRRDARGGRLHHEPVHRRARLSGIGGADRPGQAGRAWRVGAVGARGLFVLRTAADHAAMRRFFAPRPAEPRAPPRSSTTAASPPMPRCRRGPRRSWRRSAGRRCRATAARRRSRRCTRPTISPSCATRRRCGGGGAARGCDPLCLPDRRAAPAAARPDRCAARPAQLRCDDADHAATPGAPPTGSAQAALAATHAVLGGERAAFALCRPPGHHAGADYCGGYCHLNTAAIAAQAARDAGVARVAILDIDYHHGNGTQDIFWDARRRVLRVGPCRSGDRLSVLLGPCRRASARGAGEGATLNLPLPHGTPAGRVPARRRRRALEAIARFGAGAARRQLRRGHVGGRPDQPFRADHRRLCGARPRHRRVRAGRPRS